MLTRARHGLSSTVLLLLAVAFLMEACIASETRAVRSEFGSLPDGTVVESIELSNSNGMSVRVLTFGATIQSLSVPDRDGLAADVVLGYRDAATYLTRPQYFGSTVGRYANRIGKGQFVLGDEIIQLDVNSGGNHLHGGHVGFDKVLWRIESVHAGEQATVVLSYVSPDGEGGYPGTLTARASFSVARDNELTIEYSATTDATTIVNMTNHSYFNLAGEAGKRDILQHRLTLNAEYMTPVDERLIPTGELQAVAGTPFDFRSSREVGNAIDTSADEQISIANGYDHNFVISGTPGALRLAAQLEDPDSGRAMDVFTTAPGMQFYTGNWISDSVAGKSGATYRPRFALCLEPQAYPDTPNQQDFPSARLDRGETYSSTMVLKFSTVAADEQEKQN